MPSQPMGGVVVKARSSPTLVDVLRREYLKQNAVVPGGDGDLYRFDPLPSPALKNGLDTQIKYVQQAWQTCLRGNEDQPRTFLHLSLDMYRGFLSGWAQQGVL